MRSWRVGHDQATSLFTLMHWRRKWQPTPVFLPRESQGRGSLVGAVYGVTQSRTRLQRLSSSSSSSSSTHGCVEDPLWNILSLFLSFNFYNFTWPHVTTHFFLLSFFSMCSFLLFRSSQMVSGKGMILFFPLRKSNLFFFLKVKYGCLPRILLLDLDLLNLNMVPFTYSCWILSS